MAKETHTLHLFGIKACDTMKKARTWLDEKPVNYDFHDYKTQDIDREHLTRWCNEHGWQTVLNRAGTTFRGLPDADKADMTQAKAMLESIARSYGQRFGKLKKVRVNTVSQSPTKTTAGTGIKGFGDFYDYANAIAPLGNASADACADFCVTLFSDLTRMVTMQNLFHDGGYSSTGVSTVVMEKLGVE